MNKRPDLALRAGRTTSPRRPQLLVVVGLLMSLVAGLVGTSPASAAPQEATINWRPCYQRLQQQIWPDEFADFFGGPVRFECGVVPVPLDYDGSVGGSIQLSVVRIPATNPDARVGSLFSNPGGPSGSGVEFTVFAAPEVFSPDLRAAFDIVGFDPRGILLSTPARCYGNYRRAGDAFQQMAYPITADEQATWLRAEKALQDQCAQRGNRILDHMSTANVARDMDRLRAAVGDEQLTYIGYSYGTMIGATYANLFPDNVRAMVLDSALDPVAWTTGDGDGTETPVTARLGSHLGAQDSLDKFFDLCEAAGPACPIAPGATERFDAVYQQLLAEPLEFRFQDIDPETGDIIEFVFTYRASDFVGETLSILYAGDFWPIISFIVADLEGLLAERDAPAFDAFARNILALRRGQPNSFSARAGIWQGAELAKPVGPPRYFNFLEGFPGVLCSDSTNPDSIDAWPAAAAETGAESYFGPLWTWASSICNGWPGVDEDRYEGPWNAETANPVLILQNRYDPATPYEGAVALDGLLGNSQLVEVNEGRGHIATQHSDCADETATIYLLHQTLPLAGFSCEPNVPDPFDLFGPPAAITIIIEGPDGQPQEINSIVVNGELIQPPLIFEAPDGSLIVVEPVIVPLGTGETAVIETIDGTIVLEPFDIVDESGELVSVEANVIYNAVILDIIEVPLG